jgi:hypothetical protein
MRQLVIAASVLALAGCSAGNPLDPSALASGRGSAVVTGDERAQPVPTSGDTDTPVAVEDTPAPAAEPDDDEPAADAPAPADPAPVDGPCGTEPCEPPVVNSCPAGTQPVLGDTVTCEPIPAPPAPTTCPAGTHPVLGETVTCVAD